MSRKLTDQDVIPATIVWRRSRISMTPTIVGGGYRIVTEESAYGSYKIYSLYYVGSHHRLDHFSSLRETKTAAEMHLLGLGTFVRFFNIPGRS